MLPRKDGNNREEEGDAPGTQDHNQGFSRCPGGRVGEGLCGAEVSVHGHHQQGPHGGVQGQEVNRQPRVTKIP